jgi:dTDP-4-dehydrorhamnose reductase
MKILILGGGGMLGHKMVQTLRRSFPDTTWTIRGGAGSAAVRALPELGGERCLDADAGDWPALERLVRQVRPDVVVNCVGVIKQRAEAVSPIPSIAINALLPHLLARTASEWDGRLIHFSTDCVFSGRRGHYTEADPSDAEDLYGKTKYLGETSESNALTLRTSIIGRELAHHQSLLDWLLLGGHAGVRGFTRVWWSGVTTNHLAGLVADLLRRQLALSGVYQVSSGRIAKHDLLVRIKAAYGLAVDIEPDDGPENDRSLDGARFAAATGYRCPPWDELLAELTQDPTPYPRPGERRDA